MASLRAILAVEMAFTATINSITPQGDSTGIGIRFLVAVSFTDSATGFTSDKDYSFAANTTQAAAVAAITADGTSLKGSLATISNLQAKVGSVITI